ASGPVPYEKAKAIYEKELKGKLAKGYQYAPGVSGKVFDFGAASEGSAHVSATMPAAKKTTGIIPQLLQPDTEDDIEPYFTDPDYCAQEKKDGIRLVVDTHGSEPEGTNKKGVAIQLSPVVAANVTALGQPVTIDSEAIGDTLHVFGLLRSNGRDLKTQPYSKVIAELSRLLASHGGNGVRLIETAFTEQEKRALYAKLKEEKKEGIVFKSLSSAYNASRSAAQVKIKFYETASVVVLGANDKSSVRIGLFLADGDPTSDLVPVGNVTIPQGRTIPPQFSVIEVRYLYAYRGGSLFQTTFLNVREDLDPADCWIGQLKYRAEEE
ncbi:MAG TPA: hypothetical protein VEP29_01355, partial [Desulfatiglandales bacterium]|nr:hypothetical protein [Desulfatiglandales bacterium]